MSCYHGSVVEQIGEQIEKAKLQLADLSGKKPNVFYEPEDGRADVYATCRHSPRKRFTCRPICHETGELRNGAALAVRPYRPGPGQPIR
jgi:hypothetical protein